MKTIMIAAAAVLVSSQAFAGTVIKEGPNGTSVITRGIENGTFTSNEAATGKRGGVYERSTVCVRGKCTTGWTLTDRKGRMSSGERSTVGGDGQSTTTATRTNRLGEARTRTIERTRSVTR